MNSLKNLAFFLFLISLADVFRYSLGILLFNLILEKHESEGTKIILNTKIKDIKKHNKTFKIYLNTNQILTSDLIIIGVGSLPNTNIFTNTYSPILAFSFSKTTVAL